MSLQVEKLEHNMAKLTIEVSAEEVEKALQAAYLKERSKISLPGFRKGKVPRQMIEKMYGPEVFYDEAANRMISEAYAKAYDESELEIASQPTIDIVQLEKGKPFIFTAEVAVKPEVKLGEYKGLKVDKYSTRVTQNISTKKAKVSPATTLHSTTWEQPVATRSSPLLILSHHWSHLLSVPTIPTRAVTWLQLHSVPMVVPVSQTATVGAGSLL